MIINILTVDDKEENLYLLDNLLSEIKIESNDFTKMNIKSAPSGELALKIAMKEEVDLIILDIHMPIMDGFEVAKFLKMNPKTKDIPIIFLTAQFKEEEFEHQGFEIGAIDYFLKPIVKHKFLNKIKLYMTLLLQKKELHGLNEDLKKIILQKVKSEKRLQKLFDLQSNLVIVTNGDETQIVNQSMFDFFGIKDLSEFKKTHCDISEMFIEAEDAFTVKDVKKGDKWILSISCFEEGQRVVLMKDVSDIEHTFKVNVSEFDKNSYIVTFTDISSSMIEKNNLNNRLIKDQLTGINNREFFEQNITFIVQEANKTRKLGVVVIDIDNFKKVNDTHGHNVGDSVLIELTSRIKSSIRNDDYLIRWGGDEFILLMKINDLEALGNVINNIRKIIEKDRFTGVGRITCSFGATIYGQSEEINETIQRADDVMYNAKDAGRNTVKLI